MEPVLGEDWFKNRSGITQGDMARLHGEICAGDSNQVNATQAEAVRTWQIPGLASLVEDSRTRDPATGPAADDTDSESVSKNTPHQDQDTTPDHPRFTMKKARLTPVQAENGGIRVEVEEIPLEGDDPVGDPMDDPAPGNAGDLAEASEPTGTVITDTETIKQTLAVRPGITIDHPQRVQLLARITGGGQVSRQPPEIII